MGVTPMGTDMLFDVPPEVAKTMLESGKKGSNYKIVNGKVMGRSTSVWFTNLDHGRRHQRLEGMTMAENLRFSRHKEIKGTAAYNKYANYDAIEVPFTDAIPSDYDGAMGVPITFLDKYNPEQFEILGSNLTIGTPISEIAKKGSYAQGGASFYIDNGNGTYDRIYTRIVIRHRRRTRSARGTK
jgi:hypothetical protein